MEPIYKDLIEQTYANFNARDIDAAFTAMDPDVEWPSGWESGYLVGFEEVRDYWTHQWKQINTTLHPIGYKSLSDDRVEVEVHQIAKDLSGALLYEGKVKHVYSFENGLIKAMEIENEH
ncbi:nuclear transport factor 2 family protein [Flavobacterium silvaticum]|uniref:Nuclear transport factor 2 family protein n=1 Tax=Flavobacterium silvaticum TaxID=1852020 RepID=A0A972JI34_9FLAO|nr:nuclear transport factor 2 family protein [Flavobacterium silvaticum]NMH26892.1 nuclear transport factor 2 family protein [Flavobacterium silvaticum]